MNDWMRDPEVLQASRAYEAARSAWRHAADADRRAGLDFSPVQRVAFDRMKAADRAYVWARDGALDRATTDQVSVALELFSGARAA